MIAVQQVAARAASYDPVKAVLTVVALPFYVLGLVVALVWLVGAWCVAMGRQGFDDARDRARKVADGPVEAP